MILSTNSFEDPQSQRGFWQKTYGNFISKPPAPLEDLIYQGWLSLPLSDGSWKKRYFVLTSKKLLYCKSQKDIRIRKEACIDWKILKPFYEIKKNSKAFGFKLQGSNNSQDFYVDSKDILEDWLSRLSPLTILTDFDEDYSLQKEIGRGNYSKVFMAIEYLNRQPYAVKTIPKESQNQSFIDTLKSEIEVMRKIKHPRIITLHYVYETEEAFHLVMDYVRGGELQRRLKMGKYPEHIAAAFMRNLLDVIDFLHNNGIVHRDIKPENILVLSGDNYTEFKLCDFGLSALLKQTEDLSLRCGSPGFVAPEILRRQRYSTKVDLFSAGVICYIMLTGKYPFTGSSPNEILLKNRECRIDFDLEEWNNISKLGRDFVMSLTQENPEQRPSAHEALCHPWISGTHTTQQGLAIPEEMKNKGISLNLMQRQKKLNVESSSYLQQFRRPAVPIKGFIPIKDNGITMAKSRLLMKILREEDREGINEVKQIFDIKSNSTRSKESQESTDATPSRSRYLPVN
ncbi:unnamed protein product [Blepharisma stoltei]|uniref:Uncharacterized protein n=1 Tax=Blepharisma stoltei TaxID=1481888 RepID=A0AAU9KD88_9CILI|nr:unnamed protein product [Blepharisma stoltei]